MRRKRSPSKEQYLENKKRPGFINIFKKIFKLLFIVAIISVIGFIILLPVVVSALEDVSPPEFESATVMLDKNGEEFYHEYDDYRIYISIDEMPEEMVEGIMAVEDRRFKEHLGIDIRGITRAMWRNIRAREVVEGGSTITQQLAKNYFLDHSRTIDRKVREFFLTLHLERTLSKEEILEQYLNGIYFGHGAYGVEAASRMYFGKNTNELELQEIAMLIGIPRSPYYYSPFRNPENAQQRRDAVLHIMAQEGVVNQDTAQAAAVEALDVTGYNPPKENASYFADEVNRRLEEKLPEDYTEDFQRGGFRVYTTLDQEMQSEAERILDEDLGVVRYAERGDSEIRQPQGSMVALEPDTGRVRAFVGGRDYEETPFNRANPISPNRPVGSTIKPFVYAAALSENEITPATTFTCEETVYPEEPGWDNGPFVPTDYGGVYHNDDLTIRRAIRESCNVTAVKVHDDMGRYPSVEQAESMGVIDDIPTTLSFPLGQVEASPLKLTSGYTPFANEGILVEPKLIKKVEDSRGTVIYENEPERSVELSQQTAYQMTSIMEDVISPRGTASSIWDEIDFPAAGKTGTTEGRMDAVFVGYTPELVTTVFVSDDGNVEPVPGTGGSLAAPLWSEFMNSVSHKLDHEDFSRPDGLIEREICEDSGKLATDYCPEEVVTTEYFEPRTQPDNDCDVHLPEKEEGPGFPPPWWPFFQEDND
ncbi:transglycosylase domain-containing protein [Natranaerobius thermophilus]|uniref:Penicillin-binding protein 1A n=1 Tax=Natranaerobius thermophilus (strain ATCC BAA-1301 / DSM 18059 / JW/NM-WN-LF) TaxID=457570 RepID=B2A3K3_NATTJ|nr:PBP1A family penicillin-binding protein [Natranaerobius thermophilus]ACB86432.1 penicillin-binding protein, 1A family [Natranaerobius thermophilus JW/NM-WN-LF]